MTPPVLLSKKRAGLRELQQNLRNSINHKVKEKDYNELIIIIIIKSPFRQHYWAIQIYDNENGYHTKWEGVKKATEDYLLSQIKKRTTPHIHKERFIAT